MSPALTARTPGQLVTYTCERIVALSDSFIQGLRFADGTGDRSVEGDLTIGANAGEELTWQLRFTILELDPFTEIRLQLDGTLIDRQPSQGHPYGIVGLILPPDTEKFDLRRLTIAVCH